MAQGFAILMPQRLFESDGSPAVGWKIFYTNAGLGTPVTTYSNPGLTSANTNPVVTDSAGYFRAFVAEAVIVDIVVKNASDVSQFTLESVEAMPDTSGSSPSVTAVPTGGVIAWTTTTAPTGFLLCDGSAVSRVTFATLNTLLSAAGYPFGNGDGVTTFNVPDMRGYFPFGKTAAGTGSTLGGTFGTLDHTHTGPSHTHTVVSPRDGWGGTLNVTGHAGRILTGTGGVNVTEADADQTLTTAAGGTGATSSANPPARTLTFIIKT